MNLLKGKRTYIVGLLGAVYAALIGLDLAPNLEWVWGLLGSGGLVFLRAGVTHQEPGVRTNMPRGTFTRTLSCLLLASCLLFAGCASVNQSVRTELQQTNGVVEIRETKNRIIAFWDAKQTVEKTKLSNGKTQSIGTSGVESEATSTNMTTNLRALADLLGALR